MHKIIANLFSNILSLVHVLAALILAIAIYMAFNSAGIGMPGSNPEQVIFIAISSIVSYVVIFGFLSVILRIYENQERMAKSQEEIVGLLEDISESLRDLPEQIAMRSDQETVEVQTQNGRTGPIAKRVIDPPIR